MSKQTSKTNMLTNQEQSQLNKLRLEWEKKQKPLLQNGSSFSQNRGAELTEKTQTIDARELQLDQVKQKNTKKIINLSGKLPENYELKQLIAIGGEGTVYLAKDIEKNKLVAVKFILHGKNASEKERQRFRRQGEVLKKLSHPRIIQVYETGSIEDVDYLVMEYFSTSDLLDFQKKQRDSLVQNWELCSDIVEKILEGLEYAHSLNVIHRDIKPENILLNESDLKIVDFGLAREVTSDHLVTTGFKFLGTPSYSSPEQTLRPKEVDSQSDLFSVGTIFYELLTGKKPFTGSNFLKLMTNIAGQNPLPPREINPKIPEEIERITQKALAKKKEERYFTAQEFCADLQGFRRIQKRLRGFS